MIKNDKRNHTPHHFMNSHQQTTGVSHQMSSTSCSTNHHNMQHKDQPNVHYQHNGQQGNQHQHNGHYSKQQMPNQRRPMSRQSSQGSNINPGNTRSYQSLRNQTIDSSGPDVRIRGTIYQIFEKYTGLAREATLSGDRVLAENLLQHGEHYMRLINEINADITPESRQNFQYQNQFQPSMIQPQIHPSPQQPIVQQPPFQPQEKSRVQRTQLSVSEQPRVIEDDKIKFQPHTFDQSI